MQRTEGSLKKKNKDRKRKRYFILKRKLGHALNCEILPLTDLFTIYSVFFKRVLINISCPGNVFCLWVRKHLMHKERKKRSTSLVFFALRPVLIKTGKRVFKLIKDKNSINMLGCQTRLELSLIALSLDKKTIRMITARVTLFTSCFQSRN